MNQSARRGTTRRATVDDDRLLRAEGLRDLRVALDGDRPHLRRRPAVRAAADERASVVLRLEQADAVGAEALGDRGHRVLDELLERRARQRRAAELGHERLLTLPPS